MSTHTVARLRPPVPSGRHAERRRPRLRLVGRRTAPPVPWRVLVSGLALFGVLIGLVALQAVLIGGQRELDRLQVRLEEERVTQNALRREESMLRTPSDVRDLAVERLGMVPAGQPAIVAAPPRVIGGPDVTGPPGAPVR